MAKIYEFINTMNTSQGAWVACFQKQRLWQYDSDNIFNIFHYLANYYQTILFCFSFFAKIKIWQVNIMPNSIFEKPYIKIILQTTPSPPSPPQRGTVGSLSRPGGSVPLATSVTQRSARPTRRLSRRKCATSAGSRMRPEKGMRGEEMGGRRILGKRRSGEKTQIFIFSQGKIFKYTN